MCRLISTLFETIVPGTLRSRNSRSEDLLESLGQLNLPFEFTRLRCAALVFSFLVVIADCVAAQVPDEIVVAVVDGQKITQKQVDDSMKLKIYPLAQQLATVRKVALENLIIAKVLEREALRRRISIDELRKELMTGEVNVTPQQVDDAYAQNSSFFAAMSPDEAKARLRLNLENQARMRRYKSALEKLRLAAAIQLIFNSSEIATGFEDARSPSLGPKDAALSIVEFLDFECPFCRTVQPTLKELLKSYTDVRLIFKHLPSEGHQHSMLASRAAACAAEQDRFWQYHDILFASNDRSPENLRKIAADLGLAIEKFQVCLTSEQSLTQVVRDLDLARSLRIDSTPSFLINGRVISGALSLSEFRRIIEQELEKTGPPKRSSMN